MIDPVTGIFFALAALAVGALIAVGRGIATAPTASIDLRTQRRFFAKYTGLATFFTIAGYASGILITFAIAAAAVLIWFPQRAPALLVLFAAQGLSQYACNDLKGRFGRVRPENWLYRQEMNEAYPSGHASTAVVTYGGIGLLFLHASTGPALHDALIIAIAVFVLGIGWSRIALGAHFLSDVFAGYLVGVATLCLVFGVARSFALVLT